MAPATTVTKITQDLDKMTASDLLPAGVSPSNLPTPEFIEAIKRIEQKKVQTPIIPPIQPPTGTTGAQQLPNKPPELTYQWIGNCPTCHMSVSTLMLSVGKSLVSVAYCSVCRKDVAQKTVKPLGR